MIRFFLREGNLFLLALGFFSRIPMPHNLPYSPEKLNRSSRYYTAVGWLLGALVASCYLLTSYMFSDTISIWVTMVFSLLLTGVFHEDGLADTADGFGGAFAREKKLLIMKDSRIGSYGSAALIMALLGKYVLLAESLSVVLALVIAYPLSRAVSGTLIFDMAYVTDTDTSKSKPLANAQTRFDFWVLLASTLPIAFLLPWQSCLVLVAVLIVIRHLIKIYYIRQIGGYTGDCLGAAQQVCELVIYAVLILVSQAAWA